MALRLPFATILSVVFIFLRVAISDTCNPLKGSCPAIPGLTTSTYSIDFTQQTDTTSDWILADHAIVTYGLPNGANFSFTKRKDAPYIWTRFYVLFGRIEVVLQAAPGAGIITGAVMMSDDQDEIDWEWSGNNFAQSTGQVQTNFFGKGIAGSYGRSTAPAVDSPQSHFHTYTFDWTPDALTWLINGKEVRTLHNNGLSDGEWQYPQTPARLHLGLWCSGDPDNNGGTIGWGGGLTDFTQLPYSAYVKSVKITTPNPCASWEYPDQFDGSYISVQCTNQTITLPCTYTVATGDDGYKIAKNLAVNFDTLKAANPGVNWEGLLAGQKLKVPGGTCTTSSASVSVPFTTSTALPTSTLSGILFASNFSSTAPAITLSSTTSASPPPSTIAPTTSLSAGFSSLSSSNTSSSAPKSSPSTTTISSSLTSSSLSSTTSASTTRSTMSPTSTITASSSSLTSTSNTTTGTQAATVSQYRVVAGDDGPAISHKFGCDYDDLKIANPGLDWNKLDIGQTLNIPPPQSSSTSSVVSSTTSQTNTTGATSDTVQSSSGSTASNTTASMTTSSSDTLSSSSTSSSTSGSSTFRGHVSTGSVSTSSSTSLRSSSNASVSSSASSTSPPSSQAATTTAASGGTLTASTLASVNLNSIVSSAPSTTAAFSTSNGSTANSVTSKPSSSNVVQPIVPTSTTKLACNEDNCLRNMLDARHITSSSVHAFCTGYIATTSSTIPIPTYLSGCSGNSTRVSSACNCLSTNYANSSGVLIKTAMSGAASVRKRPIFKWERTRW